MPTPRKIIPPEVLLEAYRRQAGNITATAKELGVDRQTVRNCLALYGADKKPVTGGSVKPLKHNVMPLPGKGKVKRYLLSCAQSNTKAFTTFVKNIEAYRDWLAERSESCEIMISRFTYNKSAFQNKRSKPGKQIPDLDQDSWFDPAIEAYICDDPERHGTCRWQLAPDLYWCSEMQIEATAVSPLSGLTTYTGNASSIFPHTKLAMQPVASMPGTPTKHVYTTGTVTGRNYIQRKAGLKAQFHHQFGCLIVEVDDQGDFWVRQINANSDGSFYDIPGGNVVKVTGPEVTEGHRLESINWGDVHVTDLPEERFERYWGKNKSVIDLLNPKYQFFHDTLSFRSRSHHEMKSFSKMLEKHINGAESVEEELKKTVDFLSRSERSSTLSVVVRSNHDCHGEVWLDHSDYRSDLPNVEVFLEAQLDRVRAIKRGEASEWMFLEWAARKYGAPETIRFLIQGESFVICAKSGHPIECSLHGDKGANGARGSTMNLSTVGCKISKGHDHSATIKDGVFSSGTCSEDQGYNEGQLSTWSVSHILAYVSGKRCIVTERNRRLWA